MPALDAYEDADLDEDVDDPDLAPDARAAAERAMARRDAREGRGRRGPRLPGAMQGMKVVKGVSAGPSARGRLRIGDRKGAPARPGEKDAPPHLERLDLLNLFPPLLSTSLHF